MPSRLIMQHEVQGVAHGGPFVGIAMAAAGLGGYCYHTAVKFLAGAHHTFAQAAVPGASWSWDNVGQTVMAILAILGGVLAWYSSQKTRQNDDRRREQDKDADAVRERRVADAMADVKVFLASEMAKIQVEQAKMVAHLHRQDEAIEAVHKALPPAPEKP